jgi:hypothetical protein
MLSGLDLEKIEARLLGAPQKVEIEIRHHFSPGVYVREAKIPAGSLVLGHEHVSLCINVLASGSLLIRIGDEITKLTAPFVFESPAGVRKIAQTLTPVTWLNIHPTTETNLEKIEAATIRKSATFLAHEAALTAQKTEGIK